MIQRQKPVLLSYLLIVGTAQLILARSDTNSIPRSTHRSHANAENLRYPPWNASPNIDEHGFLIKRYRRIPGEWEKEFRVFKKRKNMDVNTPAQIRQVPGDGNCLFHSISTCYAHAINGTHLDLTDPVNLQWLYQSSSKLREQAVDCLGQKHNILFLQGHEYLKAQDLVQAAASQYGISGEEYCHLMRQDSYWGGGPEIVALCNVLQRPIHVYELASDKNRFVLRRMACFGSPKFDRKPALHILSADSRFPDLTPGRQLASGNHFLALFPETIEEEKSRGKKRAKLRGGGDRQSVGSSGAGENRPLSLRQKFLEGMWSNHVSYDNDS
jgi:OTU-like cysteine protease